MNVLGTQLITSLGAEAVERASIIARQADVVAALTLEVLKGTSRAFDSGEWAQEALNIIFIALQVHALDFIFFS